MPISISGFDPASVSLTTDYLTDTGSPEAALRALAEAGFTHVHWCHHWHTDFVYGPAEVAQVGRWLREFGLRLLDLHGSAGQEKCWWSANEWQRLAGVELVQNRLKMTAKLGGAAVVMHLPELKARQKRTPETDAVTRSIDELLPTVRRLKVRLAVENMPGDNFRLIDRLLDHAAPEELGLCYDSGHGNMGSRQGLKHLERHRQRLIVLHLHDNDARGDQHLVPLTGTVDFPRLTGIIARSSYCGCISMESNIRKVPEASRGSFLSDALAAGRKLAAMVVSARSA